MFIFTIDQYLWAREPMSRTMRCDHSLGQNDILKFILLFMIMFQCNNVVISSLIIFCLNCNQHVIDIRYFEISQHHVGLSTSYIKIEEELLQHWPHPQYMKCKISWTPPRPNKLLWPNGESTRSDTKAMSTAQRTRYQRPWMMPRSRSIERPSSGTQNHHDNAFNKVIGT
jgi:hypothetical protein